MLAYQFNFYGRYPSPNHPDKLERYRRGVANFLKAAPLLDQGILDQRCAPMLLVNGKQDTQCPIEDLYLLLEHGEPKTARVFEGGHMAPGPRTVATITSWVAERLA